MEPPMQQDMNMHLIRREFGQARSLVSGFNIWVPDAREEEAAYDIVGSEFSQVLEIQVRPGETVTAEPGTMLYTSDGISLGADVGGLEQGLKRCCCAGENLFRLHLEHSRAAPSSEDVSLANGGIEKVALTPRFPAKIVPIDLRQHDGLVFNRGAFLAALGRNWSVDIKMVSDLCTCCFAGQGLFMNTLHGDSMVFLNAGGTVMTKHLQPDEKIVVDHHAVLAFERTVSLSVRQTGSCMACCCAGQGLFNAELAGPGFVMVHSMGLSKLKAAVAPQDKKKARGAAAAAAAAA